MNTPKTQKGAGILAALFTVCLAASGVSAQTDLSHYCTAPNFSKFEERLVDVGHLLFFDPILSGNQNVACATCHHPDFATADGVALGLGDGGKGIGPEQTFDPSNLPEQRIPRNAPALFNLGAAEFTVMFHDGRLEEGREARRTPFAPGTIAHDLPMLAAQALLPLLSPDEMAGHYSENAISKAVRRGEVEAAWAVIAARVFAVPEYAERFAQLSSEQNITQIAKALGAFIATEWQADDSPFDRYICQQKPLSAHAITGAQLFYGKAKCSACHSGRFQTDHGFHAIAMPQIGPGKAERYESHARDTGRQRVTGDADDAYRFRTPSLRNVALTAPYGHVGAYADLEDVVRHHLDPVASLRAYDPGVVRLAPLSTADDFRILNDPEEMDRIAAANELMPIHLSDEEVASLITFLHALTDASGAKGRLGRPDNVPSGLQVP